MRTPLRFLSTLLNYPRCIILNRNRRINKFPLNFLIAYSHSYASYQELKDNHSALIDSSRIRDPRDIKRHIEVNKKKLIWERINVLLDKDKPCLELSPLAGVDLPYGTVPNAGTISLLGSISGVMCLILGNDATCKGGTTFPINLHKTQRALRISMQNLIPVIHIVDSGGAFLPLQAEIFPDANHGGRIFCNQAIISAMKIPQIAYVCGSCTAGAAYIPSMSDEAVIVEDIGTIFLAGPALVKAATGEDTSANELGGAMLHSTISGGTDYYCRSEDEAFLLIQKLVCNFNLSRADEVEYSNAIDPTVCVKSVMEHYIKSEYSQIPMKDLIVSLVDKSDMIEFKSEYGKQIITSFASIQNNTVGIIANNGSIGSTEALKATHFVQLCNQRNIPLLFIVNLPPRVSTRSHNIKEQSGLIQSISQASVPMITLIVGESSYPEAYTMCSRAFEPNFLFVWPTAKHSFQDGTHKDAYYGSARLWDDGVILPEDTRRVLAQSLRFSQVYNNKDKSKNLQNKYIRM
ncbi:Methylcrotonoyl-CoA carboxylase beta chain, mitochondrial-like isoform X1 [Oopsacas minuta]|uniref:methylcrotonoyl-CoA carboxylase n=1 Tax=Oopsacas minuta TaxID=111878 RepID=A0AAV7K3L4_9METZ|nr:Methylcrotonoyl-CoA carboxylase beta chain, mitochondrial-like isoform X1 [Oopsacas minuta]